MRNTEICLYRRISYPRAESSRAAGSRICVRQSAEKAGTPEVNQIRASDEPGIRRDVFSDMWDEMYAEAQSYYQKYNDLNVSRGYTGSNGKRLDMRIQKQRREYDKLSAEQRKKPEKIGMLIMKQPQSIKETSAYV